MKKIVIALLLLSVIVPPSHAINIFEKIIYKKDVIKAHNAKVLVNPLTGEIKYLWNETVPAGTGGHWEPVTGTSKAQFQAIYDIERKKTCP